MNQCSSPLSVGGVWWPRNTSCRPLYSAVALVTHTLLCPQMSLLDLHGETTASHRKVAGFALARRVNAYHIPSPFSMIFAVPKSVIWMCMSSPSRMFSGFRSLWTEHMILMWQSCDNHVTIMWQSCDNHVTHVGKSMLPLICSHMSVAWQDPVK